MGLGRVHATARRMNTKSSIACCLRSRSQYVVFCLINIISTTQILWNKQTSHHDMCCANFRYMYVFIIPGKWTHHAILSRVRHKNEQRCCQRSQFRSCRLFYMVMLLLRRTSKTGIGCLLLCAFVLAEATVHVAAANSDGTGVRYLEYLLKLSEIWWSLIAVYDDVNSAT